MKYFISIFFLSILLLSCTEEPKESSFKLETVNQTNTQLTIEYYLDGILQNSEVISSFNKGFECEYFSEEFIGYGLTTCNVERAVFRFDNGKGYISDVNQVSGFDFPNETGIFGPSEKYIQNEDGIYQFIITQQDFDDAFDLP